MGADVRLDAPKTIIEAVVETVVEVPIVAGITSRRATGTARIDNLIRMSDDVGSGAVCQHLESATTRQQIADNNEWCCRNIKNSASDHENAFSDIGESSPAVHDCATLGKVRRTGGLYNDATSYRRGANDFRTATHHRTTTHHGFAGGTRIAKDQSARTVGEAVAKTMTETVAEMGTITEMGHPGMKTWAHNTANHGKGRQKTYENCGYFNPFHWIPHILGDKGVMTDSASPLHRSR